MGIIASYWGWCEEELLETESGTCGARHLRGLAGDLSVAEYRELPYNCGQIIYLTLCRSSP